MSPPVLSPERLRASDPERSAWVCANAGAGKTSLLVIRVLRMLLSGVLPQRILCITYTKAAAAEMKQRILSQAMRWNVQDETELKAELAAITGMVPPEESLIRARALFALLVDAPEGLRIQTIHSFCQSLLARFPLEAGVAPHAEVLDERSAAELLQEAMQQIYAEAANGPNTPLAEAMRVLATRLSEAAFHDLMREIILERGKLRLLLKETPDAASAAQGIRSLLSVSEDATDATLFSESFIYMEAEERALLQALEALRSIGGTWNLRTAEALEPWLSLSQERFSRVEEYCRRFLTKEGKRNGQIYTKSVPEAVQEALLKEQERVLGYVERRRALEVARLSEKLLAVSGALHAAYAALKHRRALLDYDDLIERARALLSGPGASAWVMYKLDGGIDHILVDEAQDTSAGQWAIVRALSEEMFSGQGIETRARSLFVVGDLKQSIFRFQGAEPAAFAEAREYFRRRAEEARIPWEEIELPESFRSTGAVLKAVDAVFSRPEAGLGVSGEHEEIRHALIREGMAGRVEVWPLLEAEEDFKRSSPAFMLARHLAKTISRWIREDEMLPALGRPVQPGDIMVLLRRRAGFADLLIREFKRQGVPVAGADRMKMLENLAVEDVLALVAFLLLPADDLNLAALLKSPFFNIGEELLFSLCHCREGSLWENLWRRQDERPEFAQAVSWLAALLEKAERIAPYELLSLALGKMGGRAQILGRMGMEYAEALDELLDQALAFETLHPPSLQGFMRWMETGASEVKRDMDASRASVRVMTVHGAKGLEAPVVFLPDTTSLPPARDRLLWHVTGGKSAVFWPPSAKEDSALTQALRQLRRTQEIAEHRRLLYVAMTRASERLIICGCKSNAVTDTWHDLVWQALEPIAEKVETPTGEGFKLEVPQTEPVAPALSRIVASAAVPSPPAWVTMPPPEEPAPLPSLSPSRYGASGAAPSPLSQERIFRRGILLHRLLQHLPDLPPARREAVALAWMKRFGNGLSEEERAALAKEALSVMAHPGFAPLFGPGSVAEVPVSGIVTLGGERVAVSGQVDRLTVTEKEVWAVDYKTHVLPPEKPEKISPYIASQLAAYRVLLKEIYPGRIIRCGIVWTAGPRLDEVPASLLDEAAAAPYIKRNDERRAS